MNKKNILYKKNEPEKGHGLRYKKDENKNEGHHRPSAATIERFLKGSKFPATKNDLIEQAEGNAAPQKILRVLEQIERIEYKSPIDIAKQLSRIQLSRKRGPSAAIVEHFLKGIEFPSNKKNILETAKNNNAPEDVLLILEQLNGSDKYKTVIDISKQMSRIQPSSRPRATKSYGGPSSATVEHYLKGTEFPVGKRVLIDRAQENNAPKNVMHLLEEFEEKEYNGPIDISKQMGFLRPRKNGKPSAATIGRYLKGIHFPVEKKDILIHATKSSAPQDVLTILGKVQEVKYRSPIDVAKQIGLLKM